MRIYGVVIADHDEFRPFRDKVCAEHKAVPGTEHGREVVALNTQKGNRVKVVCAGVGKVNAAAATAFLLSEGCEVIVNAGFSGLLTKENRGAFVVATRCFEADFNLTELGYGEFEKPKQTSFYDVSETLKRVGKKAIPDAVLAPVACGDLFLTDESRGRYLNETYGVAAFDMESGAVASVCYFSGCPFLVVRQVSDGADSEAAQEYRTNMTETKDLSSAVLACIQALDEESEID